MSEVKSIYGTRSSKFWTEAPGKMDMSNFRMIFPSSNEFGFPDLACETWVPGDLGAWHLPRQRERAAKSDGAVHFFIDDYRFETAFTSPERTLPRVQAVGGALTPDFSWWRSVPRVAQMWQTYRSRWCGAFWQANGVRVVPTLNWGGPESFDFCFKGIPQGNVVAISALGVRAKDEAEPFRLGFSEMLAQLAPSTVVSYGKLRFVDDLVDGVPVREYPTFWDERRTVVGRRRSG
ncbi:hypothetical protein SEA_BAZZLE_114 [Mycobacterium phage Bazzle]